MTTDNSRRPLVLVEGFMGTAGLVAWGSHSVAIDGRLILIPSLGPVSSLHDRACELFYALLGGRVDYGQEHSTRFRHARYGRSFPTGIYPEWSRKEPLHFLGHSIGGPTIIKMQDLLKIGHFGQSGHPDMVLSINSVCAPFRGTQLVYTLGESITAAPYVRPFSVGSALATFVHILAYLSPWLPAALDVHADARGLSFRECSIYSFLTQLWRGSEWARSRDAAPYDMSFQATDDRERKRGEGRVHCNTFYRSHVAQMTRKANTDPHNYNQVALNVFSFTHLLLYFWANSIGRFDFSLVNPDLIFSLCRHADFQPNRSKADNDKRIALSLKGDEFWANDGIVPIFSQWHPLSCRETACDHLVKGAPAENTFEDLPVDHQVVSPGQWVVITVKDTNHLSFFPGLIGNTIHQTAFWMDLGQWLNKIEAYVYCTGASS